MDYRTLALAASLIPMPPPHLDVRELDADLTVRVTFAVDPDRTCNAIGARLGLPYEKSRACAVLEEGKVRIIVPRPGDVPDACLAAILRHELGHIIANLLDEASERHVGWVPVEVGCDPAN